MLWFCIYYHTVYTTSPNVHQDLSESGRVSFPKNELDTFGHWSFDQLLKFNQGYGTELITTIKRIDQNLEEKNKFK